MGRFPRWVFGAGDEPDARFTLANERTFLAWIRTSLALSAAGVALVAVELPVARGFRTASALVLVGARVLAPGAGLVPVGGARTGHPAHPSPPGTPPRSGAGRGHHRGVAAGAGRAARRVSTEPEHVVDLGMQAERTALAWRRTALGVGVGGVVALRVAAPSLGPVVAVAAVSGGVLAALAFWLAGRRYRAVQASLRERGEPRGARPAGRAARRGVRRHHASSGQSRSPSC